ncbi:MAG: lipopolysaccharide heptosyltransferase II [Nitrospirae bacterium]|nr:lipopolysaccharide heptosyltransferase II [Nitrospirota bacterium]
MKKKLKLSQSPRKLLIIKPSSLGDVVHSMPFLNVIRESFPAAEIHWVIAKGLEGLLENHPMVQKLWVIDKNQWKKIKKLHVTVSELRTLFGALKSESYDLVIDLQGLLRSGLLTAATKAPFRLGFSEAREGSRIFYTHRITGGRDIHAVDRYLKIASALGCDTGTVTFPLPLVKESPRILQLKEEAGDYAVLAPGARWITKRWPAERFGQLCSRFSIKSIIIGSKADEALAEEAAAHSDGKALSLAGKTDIKEMISIIRKARFMVTNDSGPMHIAAACGVPVAALFGPTNPARTGPYGSGNVIIKTSIDCAPCYKKKCSNIRCMDSISVEEVYEALKNKLGSNVIERKELDES